jgi:hypothetical protein
LYEQRLQTLVSIGARAEGGKKTPVIYSVSLWSEAKNNPEGVRTVERSFEKFLEGKSSGLNFPPMTSERRAFVHELAMYYLFQSESLDEEPNRSVFVTKTIYSQAPFPLLSEAVLDDKYDPRRLIAKVRGDPEHAQRRVIVFVGESLTDVAITKFLRNFAGSFVVVPSLCREVHADDDSDRVAAYHAIFVDGKKISEAYSYLRKAGSFFNFYLFGQRPPQQKGRQERGGADETEAVHLDPSDPCESTDASSWAKLLQPRMPAVRAKARAAPLETSNTFEVLRRSPNLAGS